MKNKNLKQRFYYIASHLTLIFIFVGIGFQHTFGQTGQTTAFNFQGKLNDGGTPANGSYEMQFTLFDALAGGAAKIVGIDRKSYAFPRVLKEDRRLKMGGAAARFRWRPFGKAQLFRLAKVHGRGFSRWNPTAYL